MILYMNDIYIENYSRDGELINFSLVDSHPMNNICLRLAINIKDASSILSNFYRLSQNIVPLYNTKYNLFPIQGKYISGSIILSFLDRVINIEIINPNFIKEQYKIIINPNCSLNSIIEDLSTILFVELL